MRPYQVFNTLENLRKSSSGSLCRAGVTLSSDDTLTVLDVYQQWLSLAFDLRYLHPDTLLRQAHRLWSDMTKVDVLMLNNAMAECAHLVRVRTDNGFKAHCSVISAHLFPLIKEDVGKMTEGDVFAAERLLQLFSYTGRLSLKDIDLSQQLMEEYISNENRITDPLDTPTVRALNRIVKRWFGPYCPCDIVPNHGPGGVAGLGRTSRLFKYLDLTSDQMLTYSFGTPWWIVSEIPSTLDRISQTIFVPKSYKTFRTISMEPTTLQYFQQGVWKVIDGHVSRDKYLRNHIGFHDQSRNRVLAQRGSLSRNYATLDLSSASDLVGYELVKKVFKGTWLLRYLVTLRSQKTCLPDGRILKLRKFAPMGSSLCFPVETIIFAAICEFVTRGLGFSGDYSVFGDDIIVPTNCVERVVDLLTSLGFVVNHKKSFSDVTCWFRESCGGEYIDGVDVTPVRISRKYASQDDVVRFTKLISLANNAYRKNYYALRYCFLKKLADMHVSPYFADAGIQSGSSTNFQLEHRWNGDLQREEVRATSTKSKKRELPRLSNELAQLVEDLRYRHWLESCADRNKVDFGFVSEVLQTTEQLCYQWFEAPSSDLDQDRDEVPDTEPLLRQSDGPYWY